MLPLLVACVVAAHCAAPRADAQPQPTVLARMQLAEAGAADEFIGTATMESDGTIVLRLIARGPGGLRGEGIFRYPVSDPKYKDILEHVGPLKPGETRSVRPWPD